MTRLACLALGSMLAGVLIFSCQDQAATAQATPVEDCGCDPQVIVNPVPAFDPEPRDVDMSYEKIERNLGTMVGEAHAEQDFFGVQVRLNSSLVPNAGFARIRAVWTDCKDAGGVSIPLSETDTEFSFEADTLEFEGEIRLEERDATCATLTGDLKVEVPVKFASISFSREDAIGTTKTALQYSATLTSWDPGKITVDVSGTPEASYRLLAYAEGQIPKNMFANYTRSSASARSVAVSFRGTANSATLFIPLESKTFSIPATVQVKQENDSKSVFAPEMIHPIGLPRGYVKANTAVDLEYRADTHLLSVHMPVGAPLELIAIDLLWLRATDSAGNRLNADVSIFNTTNEFSKSWYLYHEWDEPLPDLSKKEEPPELPADLQQKIDEDADLTFDEVAQLFDHTVAPLTPPLERATARREAAKTDESIAYAVGAVVIRYPVSFTALTFPREGGSCDGVNVIRDEKTVRVDLESGRLFDIPVVAIAAEFDTKSTIWLLGSNGNVQVPYPLSYHREATFYTLVWPDADGVEKILVYRINAWEEFIVPFEFGDVPAGRE